MNILKNYFSKYYLIFFWNNEFSLFCSCLKDIYSNNKLLSKYYGKTYIQYDPYEKFEVYFKYLVTCQKNMSTKKERDY